MCGWEQAGLISQETGWWNRRHGVGGATACECLMTSTPGRGTWVCLMTPGRGTWV